MIKKRYFLHKHLIKNDVIHDKICHKWLKGEELESDMNTLYNKYCFLKKENEQLKQEKDYFEKKKCEYWNKFNLAYLDNINLRKENEQLKIHMKSAKAHLEGGHTKKAIERLKIIDIR